MHSRSPAPSPPSSPCHSIFELPPAPKRSRILHPDLQVATGCEFDFELRFKLGVAEIFDEAARLRHTIEERTLARREMLEQTRAYMLSGGSMPPPPFVEMVLREKREKEAAQREADLRTKETVASEKKNASRREGQGVQEKRRSSKGRGRGKKAK